MIVNNCLGIHHIHSATGRDNIANSTFQDRLEPYQYLYALEVSRSKKKKCKLLREANENSKATEGNATVIQMTDSFNKESVCLLHNSTTPTPFPLLVLKAKSI